MRAARVLAALLLIASAIEATGTGAAPRTAPVPSTRNSPGWTPVVDPESASVLLGRRLNAPHVRMPFTGGAGSLEELGRAACRALSRNQLDSLRALCVTEAEFREILWREFPNSRPVTGLTWEDGWMFLNARLLSGTGGAIADHGGRPLTFVRFERTDTTRAFRNFRLHHGLVLVARDDDGRLVRQTWLRSVAERRGRFKIYSTDD
jgi:hypothetical protein